MCHHSSVIIQRHAPRHAMQAPLGTEFCFTVAGAQCRELPQLCFKVGGWALWVGGWVWVGLMGGWVGGPSSASTHMHACTHTQRPGGCLPTPPPTTSLPLTLARARRSRPPPPPGRSSVAGPLPVQHLRRNQRLLPHAVAVAAAAACAQVMDEPPQGVPAVQAVAAVPARR